jgi:cysteine desulfurase
MDQASGPLIYLDHNATTPLAPPVVEAMARVMREEFGNPSSPYSLGQRAMEMIENARNEVALVLGCDRSEVIFTSGGSESNNMVVKGLVDFARPQAFHAIVSAIEHPAILNPCIFLMEVGANVTILPVDSFGLVNPDDVRKAIRPETGLISIMLANNETGTLEPIQEIAAIAAEQGVPFHTDAAQAVAKIPLNVKQLGVDFLTVAGHKLYGPKGVGALFIKNGRQLTPLIHGGGQEKGNRSGTENTILIAGLGEACRVGRENLEQNLAAMTSMRDRLQALLFEAVADLVLNGHPDLRLPNTLNVSVPGVEGARILEGLPGIAASTGAACHDRSVKLSHVLAAMGVPPEVGMGALRFTVGRTNTMEQIEKAAWMIIRRIREMRR